jgi:flagellar biosynthetic protein FliQ
MTFDGNIDMLEMAFWQIILSSGPVLLIALAIGLFIGIFQAATSINEMTLSFVPKVILVMLTLLITANFLFISLSDYFQFIFDQIVALN